MLAAHSRICTSLTHHFVVDRTTNEPDKGRDAAVAQTNKFTRAQEKAIREVGQTIERARVARRLSVRAAADRTKTKRGPITEFTWRRVEKGYVKVGFNGGSQEVIYRPQAETLAAICEVVNLDVDEMCRKVGLEPPPPYVEADHIDEITAIRLELEELTARLAQLELPSSPG